MSLEFAEYLNQRSAIPGIGIEVLTMDPVLVLVLGIDLGHLEVLVLVLGIDLGHLEVLVLVLGIDLGHLEVLVLVLGIALGHPEVLVLVLGIGLLCRNFQIEQQPTMVQCHTTIHQSNSL